ncbi:hypothetical protein [Arthrobacter sp. 31Y]|uniref:hypothetical protein n=1 Tax=Arthrobacter sp. 31Y TaxID=1115632 RepID=UPI0004638E06|nr:hypothetical protein [Arthrobacter sp. 31Y]
MNARETTKAIESALLLKYTAHQTHWAVLRELSLFDPDAVAQNKGKRKYDANREVERRRIDMLLINLKRRGVKVPNERMALEIKVTRADFKRDTEDKRRAWMAHADRFAYVTPAGLITKDELPAGCGLIEYHPDALFGGDRLKWKVTAPYKQARATDFDQNFIVYLANRLSTAEQQLRRTNRKAGFIAA